MNAPLEVNQILRKTRTEVSVGRDREELMKCNAIIEQIFRTFEVIQVQGLVPKEVSYSSTRWALIGRTRIMNGTCHFRKVLYVISMFLPTRL